MYYIYGRVRAIPTYRVYRLYDNNNYIWIVNVQLVYVGLAQARPNNSQQYSSTVKKCN